jgi:hypothetical protein
MPAVLVAMAVFGVFFVVCILALMKVNSVTEELYMTDRKRWRELGGPIGYFWRPSEKLPFFESVRARNVIRNRALFFPGTLRRQSPKERPSK